jgi:RecG-like helicase
MPRQMPVVNPLTFMPLCYKDLRTPVPSSQFEGGVSVLSAGSIASMQIYSPFGGPTMIVDMKDAGGYFQVVFYHFTRFQRMIFEKIGMTVYLWGAPKKEKGVWRFTHPEFPDGVGRILPIYQCPKGIGQARMREYVWRMVQEYVASHPESRMRGGAFPLTLARALQQIHYPVNGLPADEAYERLGCIRIAAEKHGEISGGEYRIIGAQ